MDAEKADSENDSLGKGELNIHLFRGFFKYLSDRICVYLRPMSFCSAER
jgi:hypothetical protein